MNIIKTNLKFTKTLQKRQKTDYIILHHMAGFGTYKDIHSLHLSNGYVGAGYHFFVSKDGKIYSLRPIDKVGAHTKGVNITSVGVCFEGNFEKGKMSDLQINAGKELIKYLKDLYVNAKVKKHSDFNPTLCPGKNFPFDEIKKGEIMDNEDILKKLMSLKVITDYDLWKTKMENDINVYYLLKKMASILNTSHERREKLETINDLVWEMSERKIIENKSLWLEKTALDKNIYYIFYKAVNFAS